jgi:hypothetical protein
MRQRLAPFLVLLEARYAPLLFAVSPQSYAVYLWLFPAPYDLTGEVFAVLGALGFEFVYVGAIAWAEDEKASWWTWGTAAVALVFSVLVAYYVYRSQGAWALLHAGFPLVAFFYTMQLHGMTAKKALEALPERSRLTGAVDVGTDAADTASAQEQALLDESLEPVVISLATNGTSAYSCPHCQAPLRSKQARGAAVANGYCPACKVERLAAQRS